MAMSSLFQRFPKINGAVFQFCLKVSILLVAARVSTLSVEFVLSLLILDKVQLYAIVREL